MLRDINEPFDALELTFPNGTTEFWKNDVETYAQYYERVGYELRTSGNFKAAEICKVRILVGASATQYDVTDPDLHRVIWEVRDIAAAADKFKAVIIFEAAVGEEGEEKKPIFIEVYFVSDSPAAVMRKAAEYLETRPGVVVKTVVVQPIYPLDSKATQTYSLEMIPTPQVFTPPA